VRGFLFASVPWGGHPAEACCRTDVTAQAYIGSGNRAMELVLVASGRCGAGAAGLKNGLHVHQHDRECGIYDSVRRCISGQEIQARAGTARHGELPAVRALRLRGVGADL
jgi:hypothetical protein